jgi:signal peptidase I
MVPTLRVGDTLLVDTRYYGSHQPARGDVAVFTYAKEPDVRHIQRIVAVAKDRVEVNGGRVVINGQAVNEPYIDAGDPEAFYNTTPVITVADGFVFVMGDSRANSADSRQTEKGPVPLRNLIGRATDLVTSDEISRMGKWIGTPAKP